MKVISSLEEPIALFTEHRPPTELAITASSCRHQWCELDQSASKSHAPVDKLTLQTCGKLPC